MFGIAEPSSKVVQFAGGTPMRPAIASRCTTALVLPPMAASVLIAFSNARG